MADAEVKDGGNKEGAKSGSGKRWAAEKDWERHRPTITQLYITENRTLLQVMEMMKKEYDFSATARMYKARFERWHLWKNERAVILSPPDSTASSDDSEKKEVQKRWATEEDWENQRATITQLYVRENRTLAKLMEVMENEHKFHATPKMYKSRFKRWGLWKNTRAADVVEIIRQKAQRDANQQPTDFFLNGKQVDIEKVEAYIKRRRKQLNAGLRNSRAGNPSNALVSRTPEPDIFVTLPSPSLLSSPGSIKFGEDTYKAFRDYFDASLSMGRWEFQSEQSSELADVEGQAANKVLLDFYQRFKAAVPLIHDPEKTGGAEGMKMLRICFAELPDIVRGEDPMLLYCILALLKRLHEYENTRFLAIQLARQLEALSAATAQGENGQRHPMQCLWRTIVEGIESDEDYRPEEAAPIVIDMFKRHLGAYHSMTIEWCTVNTFLTNDSDEAKEDRLRSLCSAMDRLGTFDERHVGVRMNLVAHVRKFPEKLDEAAGLVSEILDDPARNEELRKLPNNAYNYVSLLAEIKQLQGDLVESEKLYWDCLGIAKDKLDINQSDLLHCLRALEENLRLQGKNDKADAVLEERRVAIKESLERVGEEEGTA